MCSSSLHSGSIAGWAAPESNGNENAKLRHWFGNFLGPETLRRKMGDIEENQDQLEQHSDGKV